MVYKDYESKDKGWGWGCVMNDSIRYLDHLNGKQYNRNIGMNMKVGLEQDIRKFESLKAKNKVGVKDYEEFDQRFEQVQQKKGKSKTIEQESQNI